MNLKMIPALLSLLATAPFAVGIYIGTPTGLGEFGFAVQLQRIQYHKGIYQCSGSIISPNIVVTAGHCILEELGATNGTRIVMKITAGEIRLGSAGVNSQIRLARRVIVHDAYNRTESSVITNDLAVLVLSHPLTFNEFVYPVGLHPQNGTFDGASKISGWGSTATARVSKVQMKAEFDVLTDEQCGEEFADYILRYGSPEAKEEIQKLIDSENADMETDTDDGDEGTFMCATSHDESSICTGDSGGGLICDPENQTTLCGIASWTLEDNCVEGKPRGPSVFTRVSNFSAWIQDIVVQFKTNCSSMDFDCGEGTCVSRSSQCDGKVDCPQGGVDEINCGPCGQIQFRCTGTVKCIDAAYVCDGTNDCGDDGADELGCDECRPDQFSCGGGPCIDKALVCDGIKHCPGANDEMGCGHCSGSEFKCRNGKCVHQTKVCDGHNTCRDGSDELGCGNCSSEAFGPNCADLLPLEDRDQDDETCDRSLDFAICISRSCAFNVETRECISKNSLVNLRTTRVNIKFESSKPHAGNGGGNPWNTILMSLGLILLTCNLLALSVWVIMRITRQCGKGQNHNQNSSADSEPSTAERMIEIERL